MDYVMEFLTSLNVDWITLGVALGVLVLVYLASISGIAVTGNTKRLLGALASFGLTYSVATLEASAVPTEIVGLIVPAFVAWVVAALAKEGLEAGYNKLLN